MLTLGIVGLLVVILAMVAICWHGYVIRRRLDDRNLDGSIAQCETCGRTSDQGPSPSCDDLFHWENREVAYYDGLRRPGDL